jgi:hypothetical protein
MAVNDSMTTAAIGPATYVRSLFSKYENVHHPLISNYISSIPETLTGAVNKVLSSYNSPLSDLVLSNRKKLKLFINKFHDEANTMTPSVRKSINLLNNPVTQILVSIHQPNLFAYGGVFKKIILLQTIKGAIKKTQPEKKFINLFLIVDHDFMDDLWIRLAQLPSIRHSGGILELRMPVSNSDRWRLVCNMPIPRRTIVDYWRRQVYSWIRNSSSRCPSKSDKSVFLKNLEEFWHEVEGSYSGAKSYSDFNAFLISRLLNLMWGYDTLFVRLSDLSPVFEDGFKFLISNFGTYSRALSETENMFIRQGINTGVSATSYLNAPVWLHCKCGSKASAKIIKNQEDVLLVGTCISCKRDLQVNLGKLTNLDIPQEDIHQLSPRAIPILLLLSRDLGISSYASGTGGSMDYAMVGSVAFQELSIKIPLTIVWPSKDLYTGLGQSEALDYLEITNKTEVTMHKEELKRKVEDYNAKIKPLLEERSTRIKSRQSVDDLLSELFILKEKQRNMRRLLKAAEKVHSVVELKPCIIDYAVNFGIVNTERLWRNGLIENDNLASPIHMN